MSLVKYTYWYFSNSIEKDTCEKIKLLGIKELEKNSIKGIAKDNQKARESDICWLDYNKYKWIYDLLVSYVEKANDNAGWKYDFDYLEQIQFTKYGVNQFYDWHCDGVGCHFSTDEKNNDINFSQKVRKLSVSVNLCDPKEYVGGDLIFKTNNKSRKKIICNEVVPQGSVVVFPSHIYHKVNTVTSGTRYSLVMWCRGYPFK